MNKYTAKHPPKQPETRTATIGVRTFDAVDLVARLTVRAAVRCASTSPYDVPRGLVCDRERLELLERIIRGRT